MAPMIVIDHGPYKWRAACIDVLPSSSLPSSAAHLPVFPHKEQTRPKKKFMSAFRPSPSRWKKKGKVQVPGGRPSSISDSGENLNGCDEIHLPAHHYFLLPATEGKKGFFFIFSVRRIRRDFRHRPENFVSLLLLQKKEKQPMKKCKPNQQFMGLLLMLRARRSLQGNRRGARREHKNGAENTEISRKATAKYQSFTWEPHDDLMRMRRKKVDNKARTLELFFA